MRKWIFIGLGVFVAASGMATYYFYRRQIQKLKDLKYQTIAVQAESISTTKTVLDTTIRVTSDSTIEAKVKDLYLEIFADNQKVGTIENIDAFIIPAKKDSNTPGISDIKLRVTTSPKLLVIDAVSLITNFSKNSNTTLKIIGNVTLQVAFVTMSVPFEYDTTLKELTTPSPVATT